MKAVWIHGIGEWWRHGWVGVSKATFMGQHRTGSLQRKWCAQRNNCCLTMAPPRPCRPSPYGPRRGKTRDRCCCRWKLHRPRYRLPSCKYKHSESCLTEYGRWGSRLQTAGRWSPLWNCRSPVQRCTARCWTWRELARLGFGRLSTGRWIQWEASWHLEHTD